MRKFLTFLFVFSLIFSLYTVAWAKEPATPELTLNDAITSALAHSKSIEKAKNQVESTGYSRDYKADQLDYVPAGPSINAAAESAWVNLLSADLNWQMSKKSLTVEEDKVALNACSKYWDIQNALVAVETAEQALKQADLDLKKSRVFQIVGLVTEQTVLGAEAKQVGASASLEKAKNDLEMAYIAFNQLIGMWPEDRPILTEEIAFTPMEKTDLDNAVARAVSSSPSVWLANEKISLQKVQQELIFSTGEYLPYEARKIELEQAEIDSISAKEAVEILTRNLYYSIGTLEGNYPAAEQAVKLAEEDLRIAKIKLEVGMAVPSDVAAAETALVSAKQKLLELKINHAYLKLAFEKPWAYM